MTRANEYTTMLAEAGWTELVDNEWLSPDGLKMRRIEALKHLIGLQANPFANYSAQAPDKRFPTKPPSLSGRKPSLDDYDRNR